ncbi:hypothetical protein NAEGRDRAFT_33847 [Naegleria gruberi]|uniref:Actin n=1 Tax=Naegleria gruberi TaxID=5762 RepID=D2VGP3_NAEGR|nr:uncharacterized protein NAEGRDRAFT_33847 [Naegleria gruberi]EFC44097.1 hypothetical protein NAEGRDRAFT_33847 [Naegleria gruberi]|eukprot:XP_002676841.1 hypothetical protein NAEGRDRAFT_33847 [Naegleria gruberi strain NEG-M]
MENSYVIDNGGYYCRIGRSGEDDCEYKCRSIVSLDDHQVVVGSDHGNDDNYVSPMERGIVLDWERMETVWNHAYQAVSCNPSDSAVLLTETILNPKSNRERMVEVLFESFQVPYTQFVWEGLLNIYASGRGSALSIMCGDGTCHALPINEGYLMTRGLYRSDFGGSDITLYLMKLLKESGKLNFNKKIVNNIKEKLCNCKGDSSDKIYDLPGGGTVEIGDESVRAANLLFDPSPICGDELSIPDMILKSALSAEIDQRYLFVNNTVLGGGSSLMAGFDAKLQEQMKEKWAIAAPTLKSRVITPPDREKSVWIGGSILTSLSTFHQKWISHKDFSDFGPSIVYRKLSAS